MSDALMPIVSPIPAEDEREKRSTTQLLQTLLLILFFVGSAGLALTLVGNYGPILALPLMALLVSTIVSLLFLRRGRLLPAQIMLPTTLYLVVTFIVATGYGLHDIDLIAYAGVIIVAGLTLGAEATLIFGILIVLSVFGIGYGEMRGLLVSPTSTLTNSISPFNLSLVVLAIAFIQRVLIRRLNEHIRRARENEQKQILANQALEEERAKLEIRVNERTADLQRRAAELRTAAEVAKAAASIQDLNALLDQTVRLLSLRFGYYHAGIFLIDDEGKYAVLRSANSEGGQRMLERGHKLEIGHVGIVGYVAEKGEARIALDVGADAVFFNNPDLPNTHSEMALPLRVGSRIAGVLDVQSTETSAFGEEDIEVLQIVADQLAISIENARLLEESRAAVEATRRAFGEVAVAAWKERFDATAGIGYRAGERGGVSLIDTNIWSAEAREAATEARSTFSDDGSIVNVPILVRGQTIGILKLAKPSRVKWTEAETQAAEVLADQLSGALESARLFDSAQRRAAKEQALGEITSKISASTNMRNVLQTAVEELGRAIPGSEVIIQFQSGRELERPEN
ncbi:MAG: GAF domain-containing protein [Chloroflexi bacterium]|nr:GAF domain-containing protein [Chloroflexota bacterium]